MNVFYGKKAYHEILVCFQRMFDFIKIHEGRYIKSDHSLVSVKLGTYIMFYIISVV